MPRKAKSGDLSNKARKRSPGPLSNADKLTIEGLYKTVPVDVIAVKLNRSPSQVENYIRDVLGESEKRLAGIEAGLEKRQEWATLSQQFSQAELQVFSDKYMSLMSSFGFDQVKPAEEMQLFSVIKNEILADRNLIEQNKRHQEILMLEPKIAELEEQLADGEDDEGNLADKLAILENKLETAKQSKKELESAHVKYLDSNKGLWRALNATREQRKAESTGPATSFFGLVKQVQEEDFRQLEAQKMELMRLAAERERARLSQPHKYEDGTIDLPLLTPETFAADRKGSPTAPIEDKDNASDQTAEQTPEETQAVASVQKEEEGFERLQESTVPTLEGGPLEEGPEQVSVVRGTPAA